MLPGPGGSRPHWRGSATRTRRCVYQVTPTLFIPFLLVPSKVDADTHAWVMGWGCGRFVVENLKHPTEEIVDHAVAAAAAACTSPGAVWQQSQSVFCGQCAATHRRAETHAEYASAEARRRRRRERRRRAQGGGGTKARQLPGSERGAGEQGRQRRRGSRHAASSAEAARRTEGERHGRRRAVGEGGARQARPGRLRGARARRTERRAREHRPSG